MSAFATTIKRDFIASIVVFLVAIPLCLGIALASGAPLFSGIVTGIIGGIVVGAISDSRISVSGPAAGMIAVVLLIIAGLGSYQGFLVALVIAGILQIIMGVVRVGFIADYVPSNVIVGLLAAIGILIIIKQLPLAFGYSNEANVVAGSLKEAANTFSLRPIAHLIHHISLGATIISVISFIILTTWVKVPNKFCRQVPPAIIAVIVAAVINKLFALTFPSLALGESHLVNIPVNGSVKELVTQLMHPNFSLLANPKVYLYGVMLAVVASLETLLNLEAAEKIDPNRRYTSRNRELLAQGVGNTLSGFLGGLPITSVIIRTSVNIQSGGESKLSTIFHGVLLLVALALLPTWLNKIPLAALASILIYTGYKLARYSVFKQMYQQGWVYFTPFVVTVIAIVLTDLLSGILIGLAVSFFFILRNNSKKCLVKIKEKHTSGNVLRLILPEQVSFLNKAAIIDDLKRLPENSKIIIDASNSYYIDKDILGVITEFKERQAKDKNITLNLEGFHKNYSVTNETAFINVTTHNVQANMTPADALIILKEGNKRFVNNTPIHKNYAQQIEATAGAQHPFAVTLACIDSRVPVEVIFDTNVGDLFVSRVAGNVINSDILASMEYACQVAGAKLILVLGHTHCGAIKAACEGAELGHITQLLSKIEPAIERANTEKAWSQDDLSVERVNHVAQANVELMKQEIYQQSSVLRKLIDEDQVILVGALYHVTSGIVNFDDSEK